MSLSELIPIVNGRIKVHPFNLKLEELKIERKINDHVRVNLRGVLLGEDAVMGDQYVTAIDGKTKVVIDHVNEVGVLMQNLFTGIVAWIKVEHDGGNTYLEAECVSHTYNLDIHIKKRSFQDVKLTYEALLDKFEGEYQATIKNMVGEKATLGEFTLQYNETDWQFLQRLASRFGTGLIADASIDKPRFWFGVPQNEKVYHYRDLEVIKCQLGKKVSQNRHHETNIFFYYQLETHRILNIGDQVTFKDGRKLYVCESIAILKEGTLKFIYTLGNGDDLGQNKISNQRIVGVSVGATVIAVEKEKVKLAFDLDKESVTKEKATMFTYATSYSAAGNTGWYCMPEVGDKVQVYFPNNEEWQGFAIAASRSAGGKTGVSEVKYWRTKHGREIKFSKEEIEISVETKEGKVSVIKFNGKNGFVINTKKRIEIGNAKKILLNAKQRVVIEAKEAIKLDVKQSNLQLDGGVKVNGTVIKM